MSTKTPILKKAIYLILTIIVIAVVIFKLKSNKETTENKVYHFDKNQALTIQVQTLKLEDISNTFAYSGTFEPNKETKVSAELQGKINEILVDAGSFVRKGESLIRLDNSLLKLQLQTIDVQIEGLESDVKRYTVLAKADAIQGIQLEKVELGLKTAKVQKATLLEQINKTTIKAPFDGLVTAKLTEEGAFAAPGVPLLQITDISNLKFTVNVPENDLKQFHLNQTYTVIADAYQEISLQGKTSLIGSKANMGSSFPVQFIVKNTSDLKIKAGMFGKISTDGMKTEKTSSEKGIIIPSSSIIGSAQQPQVYLMVNGKAKLQSIQISKKVQNKSIVSSGLNPGDKLITSGFISLFEGANVKVN